MDFSTNIKFSKDLTKNKPVVITYSGLLFKNNSELVSIVYGFGNNWEHTQEKRMEKTDEGFVVEVNMLDYDQFNFCFKNSNNEWDNNNYANYGSPISEAEEIEEAFILNENVIVEILDNLFENDISQFENNKIETSISNENIVNEDSQNNNEISFEVSVEKNEPINIEDSIINVTEEQELNADIENIFNDIYNETAESIKSAKTDDKQTLLSDILSEPKAVNEGNIEKDNFNMDSLIDEILSPIVSSSTFEQENYNSVEEIKEDVVDNNVQKAENTSRELENDEKIDGLINNLITNIYKNVENSVEETDNVQNITPVDENKNSSNSENSNKLESSEQNNNSSSIEDIIQELNKEVSLIDEFNNESQETNSNETSTSLVEVKNSEDNFLVSPRSLGKFYMFKKRVKLAFYKFFTAIPKILSSQFFEEK